MYHQKPTEEDEIRQYFVNDMSTNYIPSILFLRACHVSDDIIEKSIKKRLQQDLRPSPYVKRLSREEDSEFYEETGVQISSLDIYLQIRRDYLLLLESGGVDAFFRALG